MCTRIVNVTILLLLFNVTLPQLNHIICNRQIEHCNVHGSGGGQGEYFLAVFINRWFSPDVIATMLMHRTKEKKV